MREWQVYGPDALTLTKQQVCALLGIEAGTLERLVREGRFPRGLKPSPQSEPIWSGLDLACYLHLAPKLTADDARKKADDEK